MYHKTTRYLVQRTIERLAAAEQEMDAQALRKIHPVQAYGSFVEMPMEQVTSSELRALLVQSQKDLNAALAALEHTDGN